MEAEKITIGNSSSQEESVPSISILLVGDDLACLSIVATMLKKFKYEVVTARHPQDALYTLQLKEGAFDLVISDVHMPDMDGFELHKAIAQEFDLPVVLMSADDQDSIVSKGLDNGGAYFIRKPASADDLRDLWRFASTSKKRKVTVEEIGSLPEAETSSEKINLDEITVSDASFDENIDVEQERKDIKKESLEKGVTSKNREVSASSSPKKPKLIWTNSLHNRFLEAIWKIGLDKVVPKKILEVMNVRGLTRENVASHLQKYRIFLRRVSDASIEIPYVSEECLTRRIMSKITSSGSNSIHNNVSKKNHHPWRSFRDSNLPVSSSCILTGSTYDRILAKKGNSGKPNVTSLNLLIHDTDRSCIRSRENNSNKTWPPVENNFSTSSLENLAKNGRSASFTTPSSGENIGTSSNGISMEETESLTHRTNYVGYRISNLQCLAESGLFQNNQGVQSNIHRNINLSSEPNSLDEHSSFDNLLDQLLADSSSTPSAPNNNDEKQLSDVIADYQKLISNSNLSLQNGMEIGDHSYSALFDWDEFDVMSTEESLDGIKLYHSTLPDLASFKNHEQSHQDHQCQVSQEFEATHLLGETHRSLDQQQARTDTNLANPLEYNASSQLNDIPLCKILVEDEEFLESFIVNFPGEMES